MNKELEEIIKRMDLHNKWRRGEEEYKMACPIQIGKDIDLLIEAAKRTVELEQRVQELEDFNLQVSKDYTDLQVDKMNLINENTALKADLAKHEWQPIEECPWGNYIGEDGDEYFTRYFIAELFGRFDGYPSPTWVYSTCCHSYDIKKHRKTFFKYITPPKEGTKDG
jgi:hypothetical protein